ncbi:hypothetical protein [Alkalihalobacterium elongatum]|nr:hypothetical protein [Alkalihalobacterium elongatum]
MQQKNGKKQVPIDDRQEQLQNIDEIKNRENKQPVPQPKDFEEIEY